jgi:hypothetical protein
MISGLLLACLLFSGPGFSQELTNTAAEKQQGYQPLRAALHVHSQFSDGDYGITELASFAHRDRIDVLGVTDSFLTRVRYGIGPLRKLVSRSQLRPGVLDQGIENYLASADEAHNQFKDVIVLPGLEAAPSYYWLGTPGTDLRLYDFDHHILIFGLSDRRAIVNLPVIENATWSNTNRDWTLLFGTLLTLLAGLAAAVRARRILRVVGVLVIALTLLWSYDAWPFGSLSDPYSGKQDRYAIQHLLDYVTDHGGMAFWSYPEARFPDIKEGGATMVSRPQPEILGFTENYRGFEGIYGENVKITSPGNLWDQILLDYIHGGRKTWPSVITGIDFHSFQGKGGWHELNRGQTLLWAKNKDMNSVLDALSHGRGYAAFDQDAEHQLDLEDFAIRSGAGLAISGETVTTDGEVAFSARIRWSGAPGFQPTATVQIDVVRDGELLEHRDVPLPADILRTDTFEKGRHYYRLRVKSGASEILSNPVFCEVPRR